MPSVVRVGTSSAKTASSRPSSNGSTSSSSSSSSLLLKSPGTGSSSSSSSAHSFGADVKNGNGIVENGTNSCPTIPISSPSRKPSSSNTKGDDLSYKPVNGVTSKPSANPLTAYLKKFKPSVPSSSSSSVKPPPSSPPKKDPKMELITTPPSTPPPPKSKEKQTGGSPSKKRKLPLIVIKSKYADLGAKEDKPNKKKKDKKKVKRRKKGGGGDDDEDDDDEDDEDDDDPIAEGDSDLEMIVPDGYVSYDTDAEPDNDDEEHVKTKQKGETDSDEDADLQEASTDEDATPKKKKRKTKKEKDDDAKALSLKHEIADLASSLVDEENPEVRERIAKQIKTKKAELQKLDSVLVKDKGRPEKKQTAPPVVLAVQDWIKQKLPTESSSTERRRDKLLTDLESKELIKKECKTYRNDLWKYLKYVYHIPMSKKSAMVIVGYNILVHSDQPMKAECSIVAIANDEESDEIDGNDGRWYQANKFTPVNAGLMCDIVGSMFDIGFDGGQELKLEYPWNSEKSWLDKMEELKEDTKPLRLAYLWLASEFDPIVIPPSPSPSSSSSSSSSVSVIPETPKNNITTPTTEIESIDS